MENTNLKLSEIIKKIDFSNRSIESDIAWEDLAETLSIHQWPLYFEQERLKSYFIEKWYCTDSYVGKRVYFLDGEFIALSYQNGRKDNESFYFKNLEVAKKVKAYILQLIETEESDMPLEILNPDRELPEYHKVSYNSQILHKSAYFKGEKVSVVKTDFREKGIGSDDYFYSVLVETKNGAELIVDCRDLLFDRFTLD